jgi:hypothetical protein
MADNTTKRLDTLLPGDLVMAENGKATKVKSVKTSGYNSFYTLYHFENNIKIKEVFSHRFYNSDLGFWEHLKNWNIGDHGVMLNGEKVKLLSKEIIHEKIEGFGLFTEDGSYYANGLLSGPARCNKRLLSEKSLKETAKIASTLNSF